MSIKDPWTCKINVLNKLLKPNTENVLGGPPTSLGNLSTQFTKKKYKKYRFQSEGVWKCMKNALPPHFNIHFRGWGIKYQIIFHNKNATVLILIFWTRSSHLPVPPPLPSPLQLSCRSHREIGCAGPGGCRASPGRGGRAGPPCS